MSNTPQNGVASMRPESVRPETTDTDGLRADADCIDLDEAPVPLRTLVDRAVAGEGLVILRAGRPVAQLLPVRRQPGGWEGQVRMGEDFDDPLPAELLDAFEGK